MALTVTITTEEMKNFLRVEHDADDSLIEMFVKSATKELDGYLNNDFDGEEAPTDIKIWLMNRVAEYNENRGKVPKPNFSDVQNYRKFPFTNYHYEEEVNP